MRTLVANLKGGTGKSTVVFNIGIWRLHAGHKVTVCDLDPQRTVSDVAMIRTEDMIDPALPVMHDLPERAARGMEYLIDVGMSDRIALHDAIRACDRVLIPVTPSQADVWATQRFLEIIREERGRKKMPEIFAFLNRADPHPKARENGEALAALRMLPGVRTLKQKLVQRLAFRRSFSEGFSVSELEPRSKAAQELDALAAAIYRG